MQQFNIVFGGCDINLGCLDHIVKMILFHPLLRTIFESPMHNISTDIRHLDILHMESLPECYNIAVTTALVNAQLSMKMAYLCFNKPGGPTKYFIMDGLGNGCHFLNFVLWVSVIYFSYFIDVFYFYFNFLICQAKEVFFDEPKKSMSKLVAELSYLKIFCKWLPCYLQDVEEYLDRNAYDIDNNDRMLFDYKNLSLDQYPIASKKEMQSNILEKAFYLSKVSTSLQKVAFDEDYLESEVSKCKSSSDIHCQECSLTIADLYCQDCSSSFCKLCFHTTHSNSRILSQHLYDDYCEEHTSSFDPLVFTDEDFQEFLVKENLSFSSAALRFKNENKVFTAKGESKKEKDSFLTTMRKARRDMYILDIHRFIRYFLQRSRRNFEGKALSDQATFVVDAMKQYMNECMYKKSELDKASK